VPHSANFVEEHAKLATLPDAKCTGCHAKTFCLDCHQLEMPHPAGFAKSHSTVVEREGEQLCLRCHAKTDCSGCHEKHIHPGGSVGPIPAPKVGGN
jgi:positive regulator of sigma E activity